MKEPRVSRKEAYHAFRSAVRISANLLKSVLVDRIFSESTIAAVTVMVL